MEQNGSLSPGNTKSRTPYCASWCFTAFYETDNDIKYILEHLKPLCKKLLVGKEECPTTNKKHLQGALILKARCRLVDKCKKFGGIFSKIHFETMKGSWESNYNYCTKDEDFFFFDIDEKEKIITLNHNELRDWQLKIMEVINGEYDPKGRLIHWIFDKQGGKGKSTFAKYLMVEHNAGYLCNAKTSDIAQYAKTNKKRLYVIDLARSESEKINYGAIESLKNGLIFSGKYESDSVVMNNPILIIFSNSEPKYEKLSLDRWQIMNLDDDNICFKDYKNFKNKIEYTFSDLEGYTSE